MTDDRPEGTAPAINLGAGRWVEVSGIESVDLDTDPLTLSDGTVVDEATASELGETIARRSRPGRPSLGGGVSPRIAFRVPPEQHARLKRLAADEGLRESEVLRRALEEYLARH